jgi:dihydrofolate synthase/folylpolyglutamate synthase
MSFSSYEQALAFWYSHINYEQQTPKPSDLKLDRMRALLTLLGNPQERLRILHVAGSKGKGSTSAMLAAVLRQAGYRTGLFTSPHLCRVEERIQVDGGTITPEELTVLLGEVLDVVSSGRWAGGREAGPTALEQRGPPTFFEVTTALGFLHFVRHRVDIAVVEVGLGGRFDSTNVCRPLVALITSISFDHTRQLGNRLASIAMEKAGIVKPGRPVISGATTLEAREVIEGIARERRAPLRQLGVDFRYRYEPARLAAECERRPAVQVCSDRRTWPWMELGLLGEHQAANAAVAVACVEQLRVEGWAIPDEAVAAGLAGVSWPARLEVMGRRPWVVLDCAHNVASAQALVDTLRSSLPPARRLLIFAASNDKDVPGMFHILAPHFTEVFLTRYATNPRSVPPDELAELYPRMFPAPVTVHATPTDAWQAAQARAGAEDLICIAGSVFLAGELRPLVRNHQERYNPATHSA